MTNDLNDTTASDILSEVRKEIAQNRAVNNTSTNAVINSLLLTSDEFTLTDSVSQDGNTTAVSDSFTLTDTATKTEMGTTFRVTDADGNVGSDYPIKMAFWVVH